MRQVPGNRGQFLLIGRGNLATHLAKYFSLIGITFQQWHRGLALSKLESFAETSSHILFAISDSDIENFYKQHKTKFSGKELVHFSGCLHIQNISSVHPLMSFGKTLFELNCYRQISFSIFSNQKNFSELLPGLPNPSININPELKGKYHAYCALIGNLPQFLWSESQEFWDEVGIPFESLKPFITQSFENVLKDGKQGISGPIKRNDKKVIDKNISDLESHELSIIYQQFAQLYSNQRPTDEKY